MKALPVFLGVLLLTSLAIELLADTDISGFFTDHPALDALLGAFVGSIVSGHPVASYLLAGELLTAGASLVAVTALIISWVTVGVVQLPAEALMLGWRFAICRHLVCFLSALLGAGFVVVILRLLV